METLKEKGGVIQITYRSMDIIEDRISAEYSVQSRQAKKGENQRHLIIIK